MRGLGTAQTVVMVLLLSAAAILLGSIDSPAQPLPEPVYQSPNHICLSADGGTAYVVSSTSDAVLIVNVPQRSVVASVPVGANPVQAALSPDGQTLYVTNHHGASVSVVDLAKASVVRTIGVGYEPYGIVVSNDGKRLFVANSLSNTVSAHDSVSGEKLFETAVGRFPRSLALFDGGQKLLAGAGLGRTISILNAATGALLEQREMGRANMLRKVLVGCEGRWGFVAHVISHDEVPTVQMERGFIHSNGFSVLDLERPGHRVTVLLDTLLAGAANPWGLTLSPDGQRLYVTLSGVHEVAIVDVGKLMRLVARTDTPAEIERLAGEIDILQRQGIAKRVDAGGIGPRTVVYNEAAGELLVANYFSESLSVLDPATGALRGEIPLGPRQPMTDWRRGEMLFHDARICFQKWFSCVSCHTEDATMDGLNWDLLNDGLGNPKNAKSMHNIHAAPPAMWSGVRSNMNAAVAAGQRFLGFLPKPENHRALMTFLGNPHRAPNPYQTRNPEALARGKKVFQKARCHVCHPAPAYSDRKKHDVGIAGKTDLRSRFDTPSLLEAYRTGPYLHDGRAVTLHELLTEFNPQNLHGRTRGLSEQELDDLVEYVRSL